MDDDFNTPEAISKLFSIAKEVNRLRNAGELQTAAHCAATLRKLGRVLGLIGREDPEDFFKGAGTRIIHAAGHPQAEPATVHGEVISFFSEERVEELIADRETARKNKDWAESDRIRDELAAQGIVLEDGAGGTTWRRE